jgi:hypothetical protein
MHADFVWVVLQFRVDLFPSHHLMLVILGQVASESDASQVVRGFHHYRNGLLQKIDYIRDEG